MAHVDSFTTVDKAALNKWHGVYVGGLGTEAGEDGRWAAFTHDVRRGIAAVNACVRDEWGERLASVAVEKAEWWRLRDNCGCGTACPHEDGSCCDDEEGLCDPTLPPCGDTYGWVGEATGPVSELAYPVIVFEVTTR